jgi:hypothetical protein
MRRAGTFALALLLIGARGAHAEWQFKPFIGPTFGADTTIVDLDDATASAHRTFGISVVDLGEVFGVEADAGRTPGFFQRSPDGTNLVLSSSVTTLTGSVVVAVPRRVAEYGLRPYATIGGGWLRVRYEDKFSVLPVSDSMASVAFGGGVTGFFNRRVGVSWDVKRFQTIGGYSLPPGGALLLAGETERLSFWRATIALAIR